MNFINCYIFCRSKAIEELLVELVDAEERKEAAEKDTLRRVFFNFDKR